MANVLLTTTCNLSCDYCFARERMEGKPRQHMPVSDARKVIAFLKRSGYPVFRVLGGEPTLHPHFEDIIRFALQEGMRVDLLSNATWDSRCRDFLARIPPNRLIFLLNIDHPAHYSPRLWSRIESNLAGLADHKYVTLSFNVFEKRPKYEYVLDLAARFNIHAIRLSFSLPVYGTQNRHLDIADYAAMSAFVVDFVRQADLQRISVQLDNAIPLCIFSYEQVGELILSGALDLARNARCKPIVDIGPDLTVWCCFCLSKLHNRHLDEFSTLPEIESFYQRILDSYQSQIFPLEACDHCRLRERWGCQGGCLTYALMKHDTEQPDRPSFDGSPYIWQPGAVLALSGDAMVRRYDVPWDQYVVTQRSSGIELQVDPSLSPLWTLLDGEHTAVEVVSAAVAQINGHDMDGPAGTFERRVMAESLNDLLLGLARQGMIVQRPITEPSSNVGVCSAT